ncbi:ABC transporter substrate-binding protein [Thermococcus barophilus]|uniref:ABC transporter iron-binding periplasmic protein n=1 Tax=Thermococcus barophilus TaxID=55802 RepID=A0A0S1X9M8_THEBA|nr:ABC transporter substrate-binding protein [Thermococcus barophilus]ALM74483.1 ABC transporter iron-binding periplasmic protein [Thermococcus barophilus]
MKKLFVILLIFILAFSVVGSGCVGKNETSTTASSKTESSPASTQATTTKELSGTINFYTSIPKDIAIKIAEEFQKKYPNVKVEVYRSGASKVMAKLQAEIEAGKIIADVVWLADPGNTIYLKNKGVLMKYIPKDVDKIPVKDPEGYWIAGRFIAPVIAYNTQIIKNPPKKWSDLVDPNYRATLPSPWNTAEGWVAIPNPLYSGAATAWVYGLSEKYGWDYFKKAKDLGIVVLKSNGAVKNAVIEGQDPIGVTLDYMVRQAIAKGAPINYVYPEDGTVLIPSPIAILKTTKNPEAAKAFVDFLLSKDVQELLVQYGIIPARVDIAPPEGAPSIDKIPQIQIDWEKLSAQLEDIRNKFSEIMLG